tara:strand:+ start:726 stop:869 length:144 start_codon:yes stop_codon:yes gene_type:complete
MKMDIDTIANFIENNFGWIVIGGIVAVGTFSSVFLYCLFKIVQQISN